MVDPLALRRFLFRCLFFGLCSVVIFLKMLPLTTEPRTIPGPDLLFCLTAAWVMRRPRWAPVGIIVLMHVVADLLFMRPVGLWPALSLLGYEYLRRKALGSAEVTPPIEIGLVSACFAVLIAANAFAHAVFGIPQASVGLQVLHVLITVVFYPLVIAFSVYVTGVRRARPSDMDDDGVTA